MLYLELCFITVLNLPCTSQAHGDFFENANDSVGLGWDPRFGISNKLSSYTGAMHQNFNRKRTETLTQIEHLAHCWTAYSNYMEHKHATQSVF